MILRLMLRNMTLKLGICSFQGTGWSGPESFWSKLLMKFVSFFQNQGDELRLAMKSLGYTSYSHDTFDV